MALSEVRVVERNDQNQEDQDELFKVLADQLASLLAKENVYVRTYAPELPYFSKLSPEKKSQINKHLGFYVEICREQFEEGESLKDGPALLWRALRRLGLVPRSDLFQHFNDNSVIEIYSLENIQLFRNINFFKYSSYTLEELNSREWWALYYRDSKLNDILYSCAAKIISGEVKENVLHPVPVHLLVEVDSAERLVMEVEMTLVSPLTQDKQVQAFVVAENIKIITTAPEVVKH